VETPTFDVYYRQCLQLQRVLDDYEPQRRKDAELLNSISAKLESSSEPNDNSGVAETIQRIRSYVDKDTEIIDAWREEISKARELANLPDSQKVGFWNSDIAPIRAKQEKLISEWYALHHRPR
jgi:hypothetical protein